MPKVNDIDLMQGEKVDGIFKPHPLSFLRYHLMAVYLIIVATFLMWFYHYIRTNQPLLDVLNMIFRIIPGVRAEDFVLLILFWTILLLSGFIAGILLVSKMPLLYMVLVGAAGTLLEFYYSTLLPGFFQPPMTKLWLLVIAAGLSMFLIEFYRRGHTYFITNYRIVTRKWFISKEERELAYGKITDLYIKQGILGRVFNYGAIITISASGFGIGEDSASASAFAAAPVKKGFLGISFGGGKSVQRPRAATYFSLYGIPDPRKIRIIIGNHQLEAKEAPILRRIEDLLREKKEDKSDKMSSSE